MRDGDKATTTIPESAAHAKLEKLDRRDKMVRVTELVILFIVVIFNVFIGLSIRSIINQNQEQSTQRSVQAAADRKSIKSYVRCNSVVRFTVVRDGITDINIVNKMLDRCESDGEM